MSADRAAEGMQQQRLSSSRITRAEGTTLRPAALMVSNPLTSPATGMLATMEPSAVGSMPIRPIAEPCSAVNRTSSPMRMTGTSAVVASGGVAQVPVAAAGDCRTDKIVTGADINRDGSIHLQGGMTNAPQLHSTHCPAVYQGGLTTQFPVTAALHASPNPLQPRVLGTGTNSVSADASGPHVADDSCGHHGRPQEMQRPPLARLLGSSMPQSMPTAARTFPLQASQDNSELQRREPAFMDESQLFLLEQLTDIGKSLDVMNKASNMRESAVAEIRASIQDLRRDIDGLQSRFLDMSEVPALGSVHNDVETLRTQHLYALGAIEQQRQEHNQLHTMHGEMRQLLADHGKGLQELQARAQLPADVQSETFLIRSTQQQQAGKLQELEAQMAKHIRDMERAPALPADQHHQSAMADAERQEQTRALEELVNYVQETRQEIFSTVYSAFDEVRSEVKELSERMNVGIPHQVSTVNDINDGIMTAGGSVCIPPLRISILGAVGLRNADWTPGTGKSDPYCTCEIIGKPDAAKIKTHVVKNNLDPTWDYEGELSEFAAGDCLVFKVYDEDFGKSDDFLGTLLLKSEQFYPHGFEGALPLQEAGKGISANLRLRIPPALGQQDPVVAELREQLGSLAEAVRNEFNGLHESFEVISSRVQGAETALGGPEVVQLAATLEKEMATRIKSEALFQHELNNVAVRVEQLSHRGGVDGEGARPEFPVVQLALTKAEQSLVASSNLQDGVQEIQQEFLKLAQQQMRLEVGLAGLEDLRMKVDRIRAELDSPLEEY